jgi:hypothetical protein
LENSIHSGQQAGVRKNPDQHGKILALHKDDWQYPPRQVDQKIKNSGEIVFAKTTSPLM